MGSNHSRDTFKKPSQLITHIHPDKNQVKVRIKFCVVARAYPNFHMILIRDL
jgi:hypothetical protein